ncbi:alcohol dehydrogenase 1 [Triticum aestivum]|uniref:alcohol dehydrogenase 1 n=1 Tax=Triticum aestivum TaxID=4565 RepID=UPI001D00E64A|nr:alcohol dehydrogenase 1-like [Triticum aestivum]
MVRQTVASADIVPFLSALSQSLPILGVAPDENIDPLDRVVAALWCGVLPECTTLELTVRQRKFGCTELVNPKDHSKPVQEVLAEMTNGGVDRSVECTGNISAMIQAFECDHQGWGVAVLVDVPHKDAEFKTHPMNFLNERTLKGAFFGNFKPCTDLPNFVEMYVKKELEVENFITHSVPFSEINKAFDLVAKGKGIRCIIRMEN